MTHEKKVEKLYSHGSDKRAIQYDGFLSFGYWHDKNTVYNQAVENLLDKLLQYEEPSQNSKILNVACGYGAETFKIFERIKPAKIIAIDITQAHIDHANKNLRTTQFSSAIEFNKMDACNISFQEKSFNYVIGIEGSAHFNTRENFLKKAYQVLNEKGVLLLSDIMVNRYTLKRNVVNRWIGNMCSRFWLMPKANWISISELIEMLEKIGFKVDHVENAGHKVFPGFANFNLKRSSVKNAIYTRGFFHGLGLTLISWMLGYVYKRNMIDYVLLRAVKY